MDRLDPKHKRGIDEAGGERRTGEMTSVAELVRQVAPSHGVDWAGLVGTLLGGLTVPLGVNDLGVLRVMAVNDTAKRELEARADTLLEVWNTAARFRAEREASSLQCWVREGLKTPLQRRVSRPVRVAPEIPEGLLADAKAMTGPVDNAGVREALVQMRAKALAANRGERQGAK